VRGDRLASLRSGVLASVRLGWDADDPAAKTPAWLALSDACCVRPTIK